MQPQPSHALPKLGQRAREGPSWKSALVARFLQVAAMGAAMGAVLAAALSDCRLSLLRDCNGHEEPGARSERLESMMEELFRLHDLNSNGTLEEVELVKLNEMIAILHRGRDTDRESVRQRYRGIFRAELDPEGDPVPYPRFRQYMFRTLDALDPDEPTQAMILDQFIAEADLALAAFPGSLKTRCGSLSKLAPPPQTLQDYHASTQAVAARCNARGGGLADAISPPSGGTTPALMMMGLKKPDLASAVSAALLQVGSSPLDRTVAAAPAPAPAVLPLMHMVHSSQVRARAMKFGGG
jgi:hypothetical protein